MRSPIVAIDASACVSGGARKYLKQVLPRLLDLDSLRIGPILTRPGLWPDGDDTLGVVAQPGRLGARSREWRAAVARTEADLVFAPTEISFARYRVPLVLAARNAMILDKRVRPDLDPAVRRRVELQRLFAKRSARAASGYVAVSHYAASALSSSLEVDEQKIRVIHHGGSKLPSSRPVSAVRKVLFVSSLHRYKGLDVLLRALSRVPGDWSLDVAGDRADESYCVEIDALVAAEGLQSKVRFHGFTKGQALAHLYRNADLFVWPSRAETFGHPLVEAHDAGLPMIAARACSNEEIAGLAAHYFEPHDVDTLAGLLTQATQVGLPGGPLPRRYDWDTTASETAKYLVQVAAGG